MTNATENQIIDNAAEGATKVTKKNGALALLKKKATFEAPDGTVFETQKEATEYVRRHLVVDAVNEVAAQFTGVDAEGNEQTLGQFLLANEAALRKAYDAAKVERAPVSEETKALMARIRAMSPEEKAQYMAEKAAKEAAEKAARAAAKGQASA